MGQTEDSQQKQQESERLLAITLRSIGDKEFTAPADLFDKWAFYSV
jgi:hypothetical protein